MSKFFDIRVVNPSTKLLREALKKPWVLLRVFHEDPDGQQLPEHYKKFYYEWNYGKRTPVHYIPEEGKYKILDDGRVVPVQNNPLPLKIPQQLHEGLWGGEAIIKGFQDRQVRACRVPHFWVPSLQSSVVYSEILDKYIRTVVTKRALNLIDEHTGLDNYILKTSPADLMSKFALRLRREMLIALGNKSLYPDDEVKRDEIYNKYKVHIIPMEEVEWYGLDLEEAIAKLQAINEKNNENKPYKIAFRKEFIEHLMSQATLAEDVERDKGQTFISKLNPFSKTSS